MTTQTKQNKTKHSKVKPSKAKHDKTKQKKKKRQHKKQNKTQQKQKNKTCYSSKLEKGCQGSLRLDKKKENICYWLDDFIV